MHEDSQAARLLMFVVFLLAVGGLVLALIATVQLSTLRRELADLRRRLAGRDEPVAPPAVVPPSIPRSEPAASPTLPARATPATPPRPVAAAAPVSARQTADAPTDSLRAWGLLPLPFLFSGFALMPAMFAAPVPDATLFMALFANNVVYIGTLVLLVFLLTRPGEREENRYGAPPA